jgi:hypothetical protein
MRIDPEDIRRRYAVMSDEELLSLDPAELSGIARPIYEQAIAERHLTDDAGAEPQELDDAPATHDLDDEDGDGPPPEWIEESACVCTFSVDRNNSDVPGATRARDALRAANIPCYLNLIEDQPATAERPARHAMLLMVPSSVVLHATSILDRDFLNAETEAEWRSHLQELSDGELNALNPDVFCAGLLDRVARLRKAYSDELATRRLK